MSWPWIKQDLKSRNPSYLSMSHILAGGTPSRCKTLQSIPKHGWLDLTCFTEELPANFELELPLWMVHKLSIRKNPIASALSTSDMQFLIQNCKLNRSYEVDLNRLSPQFYEATLLHIFSSLENKEIADKMVEEVIEFFVIRWAWIVHTLTRTSADQVLENGTKEKSATALMDGLELQIYEDSIKVQNELASYLGIFSNSCDKENLQQKSKVLTLEHIKDEPVLDSRTLALEQMDDNPYIAPSFSPLVSQEDFNLANSNELFDSAQNVPPSTLRVGDKELDAFLKDL